MENEIMNNIDEVVEVSDDIATTGNSSDLGKVALVITGLVAVGFAAYKLGKKAWDNHKAKKEKSKGVIQIDDVTVTNDTEDVNK